MDWQKAWYMSRLINILLGVVIVLQTLFAHSYVVFKNKPNYIDIIEFVDSFAFVILAALILLFVMRHKFKKQIFVVVVTIIYFYVRLLFFTDTLTLITGTDYFNSMLITHGLVGIIIVIVNFKIIKVRLNDIFNSVILRE